MEHFGVLGPHGGGGYGTEVLERGLRPTAEFALRMPNRGGEPLRVESREWWLI